MEARDEFGEVKRTARVVYAEAMGWAPATHMRDKALQEAAVLAQIEQTEAMQRLTDVLATDLAGQVMNVERALLEIKAAIRSVNP